MVAFHICHSENGFLYTSNPSLADNCGSCTGAKTLLLEILHIIHPNIGEGGNCKCGHMLLYTEFKFTEYHCKVDRYKKVENTKFMYLTVAESLKLGKVTMLCNLHEKER